MFITEAWLTHGVQKAFYTTAKTRNWRYHPAPIGATQGQLGAVCGGFRFFGRRLWRFPHGTSVSILIKALREMLVLQVSHAFEITYSVLRLVSNAHTVSCGSR